MRSYFFFLLLYFACLHSLFAEYEVKGDGSSSAKKTVCLNMIVKNEEEVIGRCLRSVKPFIDYWVIIVDKESTDNTEKIIEEVLDGIPGEIYRTAWVDFAYNRNEALIYAKGKSDYILFMDADDLLSFSPDCSASKLDKDFYYFPIKYGSLRYHRIQLIRSDLDFCWKGACHEVLVSPDNCFGDFLEGVEMIIVGGGNRSKNPNKFLKDAALLEKELEKDPLNTRTHFYLAQSYRDAGKIREAIEAYQKRVDLGGWREEVFWSLYQIALLQEAAELPESAIIEGYEKAFLYNPDRAEPLYRLSNYLRRRECYLLSYLYAKKAVSLKSPSFALFFEQEVYDYLILLEYSISAWWIGNYQESYNASLQILKKDYLSEEIKSCAQNNLRLAERRLISN